MWEKGYQRNASTTRHSTAQTRGRSHGRTVPADGGYIQERSSQNFAGESQSETAATGSGMPKFPSLILAQRKA